MISFAFALLGLIAWSLAEYGFHRFVLHGFCLRYHRAHHINPRAETGIAYTSAAAIGIVAALISFRIAGAPGAAFTLGSLAGYVAYVTIHEGLHRWRIAPSSFLYNNKRRHDQHHWGWRFNFGVTTPLWDVVFGTYRAGLEPWPTRKRS
jgi:sterol desaturase/sphingolipid hydroxylase (fatty acid hydroxylase superfamily)